MNINKIFQAQMDFIKETGKHPSILLLHPEDCTKILMGTHIMSADVQKSEEGIKIIEMKAIRSYDIKEGSVEVY